MAAPIRTVAVAGSGLTAWSCGAALKRRIPSLEVKLISTPQAPDALADRMISTLPSIHSFHEDIGLTEEDTIVRAESGIRLGTLFDGWAADAPAYVHAYGPYGTAVGGVPFHQLWLRDRRNASLAPFDRFSQAAELARSGRGSDGSADCQSGLQLTPQRYGELMRAYALHVGVVAREPALTDVVLRAEDGFIDGVTLEDGSSERADLFVDCTGPPALLHSRMDSPVLDWSQWLPCDRMTVIGGPTDKSVSLMDKATAIPAGWRWSASSPRASSSGVVYHSAHPLDDLTQRALDARGGDEIALRAGRRRDLWTRNCVAVGDAAVAIEPLEWTNLHLAHSQIDRIVSMMPGRDCAPVELFEFNRQCAAEADRVRDFVCLHYICSQRSEPFWKGAAAVSPPDTLAHTLELFAERGRLPFYEEETFTRDSWLAVLLGQGFEPRQVDPLADLVPPSVAERAISAMRQALMSFTFHPAGSTLPELNPRGVR